MTHFPPCASPSRMQDAVMRTLLMVHMYPVTLSRGIRSLAMGFRRELQTRYLQSVGKFAKQSMETQSVVARKKKKKSREHVK